MSLLVVIPVTASSLNLVRMNLDVAVHLEGGRPVDFKALIVHPESLNVKLIRDIGRKFFKTVKVLKHDEWKGIALKPTVENKVWQTAARHIEDNESCESWFWWEPDACPIRKGWLEMLYGSHRKSGKTFSGNVLNTATQPYMDRCAVWPKDISHKVQTSGALWVSAAPFDRVAAIDTAGKVNRTDVILAADTAIMSLDTTKLTYPDAGLLRGSDGYTQEIVLERRKESKNEFRGQYPSFIEQTKWPSGVFAFPSYNDRIFFNCSIASTSPDGNDAPHLFTRRFRSSVSYGSGEQAQKSDLSIWKIRPASMTLEANPIEPAVPGRYAMEQWEDPRVMVHGGQTYVSFVSWVLDRNWMIRQSLTKLRADWSAFDVLCEPDYGGNASDPAKASRHEKNWAWFMVGGRWHCVYRPAPHTVFALDEKFNVCSEWISDSISWKYGPVSGGTPPLHQEGRGEYLAFFHSSLSWRGSRRRYFMGAYTFEDKPPFRPTSISEPILVGSEYDFRVLDSPLVIFPQGFIKIDDDFLVVFGVNDENCGWIRIPVKELHSLLKPL